MLLCTLGSRRRPRRKLASVTCGTDCARPRSALGPQRSYQLWSTFSITRPHDAVCFACYSRTELELSVHSRQWNWRLNGSQLFRVKFLTASCCHLKTKNRTKSVVAISSCFFCYIEFCVGRGGGGMLVQASAFGSWLHRLPHVFMFFLCLYFLTSCLCFVMYVCMYVCMYRQMLLSKRTSSCWYCC